MAVIAALAKSLFLAASELNDPTERAAYLDRECGGDAELRARVEALLRANDAEPLPPAAAGEGCGAHIPDRLPRTEDYGDPTARVGAVLAGKYKLVEELGEGGMGSVFMAQQTEPVKRAVAVKVIKAGMDSKAVLARFEAERQALAMMDHPNIAKVLDAGTTDGGRPFFVMELVKGKPITQFCDERKLTPRQRLELFVPVCQAIQHAHQKGVIHRDLKPSNVLVALYDDRPVPKIIDFGVAKAAGQALTDKTLMTGFGALVGTPEYMSPEQANLNNLDIDTRSDVYSLGVLLYELLTGTTPVDRKSLGKAAILEILRIVREVEPPKPSAKLSTIGTLPSVAANRGTEPAKLSKLMKGELDWVVLKALEKDRTRRYESANGLSRDIQRYLADEVVEARPPSAGYRLKKYVKRNKGPVVAASLVLAALLAGMAGTTWGLLQARQSAEAERLANGEAQAKKTLAEANETKAIAAAARERQAKSDADDKRREAEANLAFATKANAILGSVFEGLDPKADYATVAELRNALRDNLSKAVQELEESAIGAPLEVAAMQNTLGRSLLGLGEHALAIKVLGKALKTRQSNLGPDHPHALDTMNNLARGYQIAGQLDKAVPLFEETLKHAKAKFGPDHPETLTGMNNLALSYHGAGQFAKAVPLLEETLKLMKAKHPATLTSMNNLALSYHGAGQLDKAVPLFEETFKLRRETLGPDHPETLRSMNNLALGYHDAGQLDKAVPLLEEAFKLRSAKLGPDHPETFETMNNLALGYRAAGQIDKALPLFEETLNLMKAKLGPDHPDTLNVMNNLALGYHDAGQRDKSVPLFEETLTQMKAKLGPDHPDTLNVMSNLATEYRAAEKLDLALPLLEEAVELIKAKLGPDHPLMLSTMLSLASGYNTAGKLDKGLPITEETVKLMEAKLGPDHPHTLLAMNNLAGAYWRLKRLDQSIPLFETTLQIQEKKLGRQHPDTLLAAANLGVNYKDAGRLKEAIPLLEEARQAAKKYDSLRWVAGPLGDAYEKAGENAKLARLLLEQLPEARKSLPDDSPQLAGMLAQIGLGLLEQKKWAEAEPLLRECLAIREKKLPDDWRTFNIQSMLGGALLGLKNYADAEPLLLAGYEGMKQREKSIPPPASTRIPEALDRLIELYTATNKPEDVKKWRAERTNYPEDKTKPPEN
jgi:serine/threonine protein kinase/tetratricopeptide (TPR) repeat protein